VEIARKLLMRGLPVYDIAEDTGLSIAEVEGIELDPPSCPEMRML
jgi:hypothetical protein